MPNWDGLRFSTLIRNNLYSLCIINVHPLCNNGLLKWRYIYIYIYIYGLSPPFTLPIHMKISISLFENIFYKDLLFDRWKKNKHRFENFIIKTLAKI